MIIIRKLFPGQTDFTMAIFKIPQISKHFSAMVVGHSSYVWQIFEGCLLHCFTAFIKCNIKFSNAMSNIVKNFNYSRKLCNVNLKQKLNTVLQIFVFICSTSSRQDFDKFVTNSIDRLWRFLSDHVNTSQMYL